MACRRPRLLDLFCSAGGCSAGYARAGFDVAGVDIAPQPRYPFAFEQADALEFLGRYGAYYDVIHASPPCQAYSACKRIGNARPGHPDLVAKTRRMLEFIGKAWIMENVEGAPLQHPVMLCGTMFGLPLRRHRLFECSHLLLAPGQCRHGAQDLGVYAGKVTRLGTKGTPYKDASGRTHWRPQLARLEAGRAAMGIDWMDRRELCQAIPPAYTEYLGRQLREALSL